jgi:hypothetical protein
MNRLGKIFILLTGVISLSFFWQSSHAETKDLESLARAKAHHKNPGFINPWLPEENPAGLLRFLTWRFSTNPDRKSVV